MTREVFPSMEQMTAVLDNAPVAVLVGAAGAPLYANRLAKELLSDPDFQEYACRWPDTTGQSEFSVREFYHSRSRRVYQFSGKTIDWAGKPAHIEYIQEITEAHRLRERLNHLVNSIPGGIASYRVEDDRFIPTYFSDGVMAISGHTREEYNEMTGHDALDIIYEADRERVLAAAKAAVESGRVLDVSYRMRHKNGSLIWIHLNGRRMGAGFYAVFTGMSPEARLFQSIANEVADGIYVVDKENYDLLYANESRNLFAGGPDCLGQKCYTVLRGRSTPCGFCTLGNGRGGGEEREVAPDGSERIYSTHSRETEWNGIPAYVKYVRDVTEEVRIRREKERLEMYFRTVVEKLPGGISVIRIGQDSGMVPEFISGGYAAMLHMTVEEVEKHCERDAWAFVHPKDRPVLCAKLEKYLGQGGGHCELTGRMLRADGVYIWMKGMLSLLRTTDGVRRLYAVYTDITRTVEEQERLRRQYRDLILQHYGTPGPNELILGHCNITRNEILEIVDATNSGLLQAFGTNREEFFTGLSGLVVDEGERQAFLDMYLNAPALEAFLRRDTERVLRCFVKLPREERGRYVQFKVNLVAAPDTGDVTGILTVTDITDQTISERILRQLSVTSHDYVIDLDLDRDAFTVLTRSQNARRAPETRGCHSARVAFMAREVVVPKDSGAYARALEPSEIRRRTGNGPYTFPYSVVDETGDIRTKNMTVSAIDLRLGRVCLVCTDITGSVREQQGLLHMLAYTFELMGFLDLGSGSLVLHTRQMVLKNLPPYVIEDYGRAVERFTEAYGSPENREQVRDQFRLAAMLRRLEEEPAGYDFVFPYRGKDGLRYKQINVLWGDQNHRTICMVRADVTDMLAAERKSQAALEKALALAEEANRAKSAFLSSMSHDIRTPMNAIMGMTALAVAHIEDRGRVADCLQKISVASRHLLSLINDVLDMSRIERSKLAINRVKLSLPELMEQLSAIMAPQAASAGLRFSMRSGEIAHPAFYGDSLRINQILINLLSNAVKFTPSGGEVELLAQELAAAPGRVRYRFTVRDTGIGMPETFLEHLFSPFARENSVAHIEGTGLGLSITKGLVELMGGTICVKSRVNEGTAFRVELEFDKAQAGEASPAKAGPGAKQGVPPLAGRRFLIAEDNAINAEILCELLLMDGAQSTVRTDGAQAVQAFREAGPGTYDAILMDIQMPEMNGYEATRAIRAMDRADAAAIPIIAMTANAFAEDIQASVDAGMTAHVAKPIDLELLRAALGSALEK